MPINTLLQLDADELLAMRENLESCLPIESGPKARRVPETLCEEIQTLLLVVEGSLRDMDLNGRPQ